MANRRDIPEGHHMNDYLIKFRRAKQEDTLEKMVEGAINAVKDHENFDSGTRFRIEIEIESAYDKRLKEMALGNVEHPEPSTTCASDKCHDKYDPEKILKEQLSKLG
ncbi:hypothetical protein [Vibrio metschnikovii]|uniref:Uncharacterized protein n=1 Tax=Vibrio metschnikovii TaxID=28172 RepID=A0A9X0UIY0_VIBME|nr:hypothetical protein [Vibrio metschnikovii]MBC5851376.1 hypothetical protein [Vibrio metschnikovii]